MRHPHGMPLHGQRCTSFSKQTNEGIDGLLPSRSLSLLLSSCPPSIRLGDFLLCTEHYWVVSDVSRVHPAGKVVCQTVYI